MNKRIYMEPAMKSLHMDVLHPVADSNDNGGGNGTGDIEDLSKRREGIFDSDDEGDSPVVGGKLW